MKKTLAILLILVLVGSTTGFACDCCPASSQPASQTYEIPAHHCCPALDVHKETCGVEQISQALPTSQVLISPLFLGVRFVSGFDLLNFEFHFDQADSPPLYSDTPLYLLNMVIRL